MTEQKREKEVSNNLQMLLKKETEERQRLKPHQKVTLRSLEEELADYCGTSRSSIVAIKRGEQLPSLPVAFKISSFFNKTVDYIFSVKTEDKRGIELEYGDMVVTNSDGGSPYYNMVTFDENRRVVLLDILYGVPYMTFSSYDELSAAFEGGHFNGINGKEEVLEIIKAVDVNERIKISLVGKPKGISKSLFIKPDRQVHLDIEECNKKLEEIRSLSLREVENELKKIGVEADYNLIDMNWFKLANDELEYIGRVFDFLNKEKMMSVFGRTRTFHVDVLTNGFELDIIDDRSEKRIEKINLENETQMTIALLYLLQGYEWDYGKYVEHS